MPFVESVQPLIPMSLGTASVVKRLQREAVHSPPCSAKARNDRKYISARFGFIKNRDKFNFLQLLKWAGIFQSV